MVTIKEQLQFISEGAQVVRFHSRPGIKPETDGHHSHEVAMLCYLLTDGKPSVQLLMAALTHDLAEQAASDVSAPAKRTLGISAQLSAFEDDILYRYGFSFELTDQEQYILKLADNFSGMLYCVRERALGNLNTRLMMTRWVQYLGDNALKNLPGEIFSAICGMWWDVNQPERDGPYFDVYKS